MGAGIAGLAAAFHLQIHAPDVETFVLEAEERAGGKIRTRHVDGFVIEGGPDSFLTTKPAGIELARRVGIERRLEGVRQETRRTFVMHRGRLVQLPEGLSGLVPARLGPLFRSPLLSPWGKLRVAVEPCAPARKSDGDESLGAFTRRRMGREAYERLIEPLMSGIYGGNGDELSLSATFPRLAEMERSHGSVLKALRATPTASSSGKPASAFLAPIGGMAELVEAVERHLAPGTVRTSSPALGLAQAGDLFQVGIANETMTANGVIIAAPAGAAAALLQSIDADAAEMLSAIQYAPSATVSLGYRVKDLGIAPEGHGYIIPRREGRPLLAVTWTSNKFAGRAPANHLLVRGFFGRPEHAEVTQADDAELVRLLREELRATAGITVDPILSSVTRWKVAMPQYAVGHLDRVGAIERRLADHPGLALAGAGYRGVGIPDCIQSGQRAAEMMLARVSSEPR